MATLQQLEQALINADKAGDMDAARKLAAAVKAARADAVNQIPGIEVPGTTQQAPEPSLGQKIVGAGEAALSTVTGATTGAVGMIGGTLTGLAREYVNGGLGTQAGVQRIQNEAQQAAGALTYSPRTESGQEQAQMVSSIMQEVVPPVVPMMGAPGQIAQSVKGAAPLAVAAARKAGTPIVNAAQRVAQPIQAAIKGPDNFGAGSIGAAEVGAGTLRQANADSLPVPIKLTQGQKTRTFEQQRFERETAKNPDIGAPIRERMAQQQKQMAQNLDAFVDATGAEAPDLRSAGVAVNSALRSQVAQAKAKERALYKAAEKAGEMEAPVSTEPLIKFLQENDSFNAPELSGATLGLIERELVRLGGAKRVDGQIVPGQITLKDMELVRRGVNSAINSKADNATNMTTGIKAKEVIDTITDGVGGEMYKKARAARAQRARDYENVTLVSNLLGTKRGSTDRAIALEDVARKSIIEPSTSLDQTMHLGRLLKKTPQGQQAWKELQGATVAYIRDQAYRGVTTDSNGQRVIQAAALDRAITQLDKSGKLDYVFGKKGAEDLRTLNEVAKDVFTAPPGVVNTSNTASVLATALDTMATFGTTGVPVPAMQAIKAASKAIKERKIKQRVQQSLE